MSAVEINSDFISQYCAAHSTRPSALCDDLEKYTRDNVALSVMLSGPVVGSFLGFMVSLLRAKTVLEVGTFTGYSALCMAERLGPDGRVITLDINAETGQIAQRFWKRSDVRIEQRIGEAAKLIPLINEPLDFVFIDADKVGYKTYLEMIFPKLSKNGVIVADNALYDGEVLEPASASPNGRAIAEFNDYVKSNNALESILLPVRDGLNVIRKRYT